MAEPVAVVGVPEAADMMDALAQISLRNPWWLLLALQPWLLWLLAWLRRRWQQDSFADANLLPWVLSRPTRTHTYNYLRQLAWVLAWCAFAIAMAGPRSLQRIVGNTEASALTLQVVADASYSMSARDVLPSRMQRAKLELHDLIDRLQQVRMGLIVYAARPHVMLPATADKSVLRHAVDLLRVRELPTEGSDLFAAVRMAQQQLATHTQQPRAILILSDGGLSDDSAAAQQQLSQLLASLRQDNIRLFCLGIGTAQGAALLDDQHGWLQHNGRTVVSRLHATRLQQFAQAANGRYATVADDDSDWRSLYDEGIARLRPQIESKDSQVTPIWRDLSPWFVLPGLLLLLLATLHLPRSRKVMQTTALICLACLTAMLHAPASRAAESDYPAVFNLYQAKQFYAAARAFARLPGYAARMGEAASRYQLKQYAQAATVYIQAVLDADSDGQRAAALFNLGNSYFKQQQYAQAADTYRDALRYQPAFAAAKINLAYAQALQQRAAQNAVATTQRAGTGYHMAPAAPDTEVGKGRVGLDDSESKTKEHRPAQLDTTPQAGRKGTLLQEAKPVTQAIELNKDVSWTYDITRAQDITRQDTQFHVDESVFWQRLYESEEDYPAPRERPEVLPGVPPW
jgi:Ca-activated chloride channel family protein